MQFKPLPDPNNLSVLRNYLWGQETIVVYDRASRVSYRKHTAPLSLKAVLRGGESYNVHGFYETVTPGELLVVNGNQPYESAIDADVPVETMCVFFSTNDVLDARQHAMADDALLNDPRADGSKFEFPAIKRRSDGKLTRLTMAIPTLRDAPLLARQEFAAGLLAALVANERPHWRSMDKLDALRASTRDELYRRCLIGQAYINALFETDIALTDVARATGLSRTHFLRSFARCFGQTPYQALRQRRLERAADLLRNRKGSVTDIALAVGYNDFSAFARAFRAFHGVSPSTFARERSK